jgi:hypothetical protein
MDAGTDAWSAAGETTGLQEVPYEWNGMRLPIPHVKTARNPSGEADTGRPSAKLEEG